MRTLVTGGAGFIGSHTVDALLSCGHEVTVLDNFFSGREKNLTTARKLAKERNLVLTVVDGDVSDPVTWKKLPAFEAIFHIAAQTSVTASVKESDRDFLWNVSSAKYLCDFIRNSGTKYLVYTNTAGALYGAAETVPTPETSPLHPTSPYGATKSFLETYMRALSQSLKMEEVWSSVPENKTYFTWASLRLANVYGPRQITKGEAGVVPIFIEKFLSNDQPTIFGTGGETRDYVHVADVVAALMLAFSFQQKRAVDDAFNVGTGVETSTQSVFDHVRKAVGPRTKIHSPLFSPLRPGELTRSCLNTEKIKTLGWAPTHKFATGVEETTVHYIRSEHP